MEDLPKVYITTNNKAFKFLIFVHKTGKTKTEIRDLFILFVNQLNFTTQPVAVTLKMQTSFADYYLLKMYKFMIDLT